MCGAQHAQGFHSDLCYLKPTMHHESSNSTNSFISSVVREQAHIMGVMGGPHIDAPLSPLLLL